MMSIYVMTFDGRETMGLSHDRSSFIVYRGIGYTSVGGAVSVGPVS